MHAAEVYGLLLDETVRARRIAIGPPEVLAAQLRRLGATYEQHYRRVAAQEQSAGARGAQDILALYADLRGHLTARQATALTLRATVEALGGVVAAQRATVRAYNESAGGAYALAADALARSDLDGARTWQATAADLGRIGELHEGAERLAIAARNVLRELDGLLDDVITGVPVDHVTLAAHADAATAALRTYQEAVAALPPATPPALPRLSQPPFSPLAQLRREIHEEERALEVARQHNLELGLEHRHNAWIAREKVFEALHQAALHGRNLDDSAPERTRRAELDAMTALSIAQHHTRMAERYEAAAAAADHALEAAYATLAALNRVNRPDKPKTLQVESAMHELRSRRDAYESASRAVLPSAHALLASYAAGPIANLPVLTELVNDMLRQEGVATQLTQEELRYAIRQAFRGVVSEDGLLLRLNVATGTELRIKLTLDDLMEVARPGGTHSETMYGRLRQGGGRSSVTGRMPRGLDFDRDLMDTVRGMLRFLPFETARQIAEHGVLRLRLGWDDGRSVTTSAQNNWVGGNVEDNRGMAAMFSARASWEVELRTASGHSVTRELPADSESARQNVWIAHAYLTDPPKPVLQLPKEERQQTPLPEHVVTGMTGLITLADDAVRLIEEAGLRLSPVARSQVLTTFTEDLPSYLGEAVNNPSGLRRTITVHGRARATVTVRTAVLPGGTLVGGTVRQRQERHRTGSSIAGQSRSNSHDKGLGADVGATTKSHEQQATPELVVKGTFGGNLDRAGSTSTSETAASLHPGVQAWDGQTQSYLLNMVHTVTIQVDGQPPITLVSDPSTGLFRMTEPDAYRYGLPVDTKAEIGRNADGSIVLRGDPVKVAPPGRTGVLPTWLGSDPGQTRGAGPALVQQVTGMNQVRAQVEDYLRDKGVLPKLKNGVPDYSMDPWLRASQMANEQLVAEQFSAERLETDYDQAAQEGLLINLVHHRTGLTAEHYTLRIKLEQDFDNAVYEGVSTAERVVTLDIGSDTYTSARNQGTSAGLGIHGEAGLKNAPGGVGGYSGGLDAGRGSFGEHTTGSTVNQVKLMEGLGQTAVFRVPHTVRVDRLTGPNLMQTVAEGQTGDARVLLPADLLPLAPSADGHPRPESPRHPTSERAFRLATVAHLDVGDIATAAANKLAKSLGRDSPEFQHLAAFFNVRGLISHREVFSTGHRTGVDTRTAAGAARHQPVSLHLRRGESRFLSATDVLVGDINLTLGSHSSSGRQSRPRSAGGGLNVPVTTKGGTDEGAGVSWGRTTALEQKIIAGPERLGIDTGKQYAFVMDVTPELTVGSGADARTTQPDKGTVVYLLAERDALDLYASGEVRLPLHQVADAAERLMNGNLKLSRRVAVRFMDRYLQDLAQARAESPGLTAVPGVPLTSEHSVGRALAALLGMFPTDRLVDLMPPGVPPGRPGETDSETIERMLRRTEFHPHVLDNLRAAALRLENGEVAAALAPTYQDAIGMSTVKGVSLHPANRPGSEVELLEEIVAAVEEVAPGALDQDTALWRALTNDFSGNTWLGKIDSMLDPDSPPADYTVRVGRDAEALEITVRAELGEDARYRGEVSDYGQILQLYTMLEDNASESAALTGSAGFKGSESTEAGAAGTDLGHGNTGASNMQQTRIQRVAASDGTRAEVRQGIRLVVEVRRVGKGEAPRRAARRQLSGTIDRIIPPGMVTHAGAATAPAPAVADPRPFPVPENFAVESTRAPGLAQAVEQRLKAALGLELTREGSKALARLLSGNGRNALFERMTAKDGFMVLELPMPGGRMVRVRVGAVLSDPVVMARGHVNQEIGQVDRRQWSTSASSNRARPLPLGITVGSNDQNTWVPGDPDIGMSAGYRDQAGDGSSVSGGNRDETSVFEKARSSSVRFRVDYDVRFEVWSNPATDQRPSRTIVEQRIATGDVDTVVHDHVLRALAAQAENPRAAVPPADRPARDVPGPPVSLADLGVDDHHRLAAELARRPGPVHLDADLAAPPYGQLRQAQLAARELNAEVRVTVHLPGGPPRTYLATPDGRLAAQEIDGGFGRRFSGMPSALIAVAEQHGIDLHALHERTSADGDTSLAEQLRRELTRRALPQPAAPAPAWPIKAAPDDTDHSGSTHGSPDPDSGFIPDGRTDPNDEDLTPREARQSFLGEVTPEDFGEAITEIMWEPGGQLIVRHAILGELHFTVTVGPVEGGYLGETTVRGVTGTSEDPHIMTLAPRVARDQVARLVLHEISDVLQHRIEGGHRHTPGGTTRDECVTARRNELRFLERKQRAALAAGDAAAADKLAGEITAVERDLAARTRPSRSIDDVINWTEPGEPVVPGVVGEPEPVGANVSRVTLTDGSSALLLEHSTRQERDLQLLVTRLANRLGLVGSAQAAGDRHILIDFTPADVSPGFLGTREAVLAGYLVAVADMTPLVAEPALHVPASGTPLLELFLREDASGERTWGSNPLTWPDVRALRTLLESSRTDFAQLDMLPDFERIMDRHRLLASNAAGREDVVTAAPGQSLVMADIERLRAMDEGLGRLKNNLRHGIVSRRVSALGSVVTFADGSQALEIPRVEATDVLVFALVRRALGLPGPAVHLDRLGNVYRTFGSDRLRASVATGIQQVIDASPSPGGPTTVVLSDGTRALRREFPTQAAADEYEARLEETSDVTDGLPRSHRADPFTVFEEIVPPPERTAAAEARLATRALCTFLSMSKPMSHRTLRRLLDANPILVRFGQAYDWDFRAGAPVLSARDVTELATRLEALHGDFDRLGLGDRHQRILSALRTFIGSDEATVISLTFSEGPATAEHRAPAWQPAPEPAPVLADLMQGDHLWRVNARNQTDVISRADSELAERPNAQGHVFARVPGGVIPGDIQPGAEFTVNTLLDGVDNADRLGESPHGVRVTILASDYVPVGDLSADPHRVLFRAGARFAVTAVLTTDDGESHYFLTQQPTADRTGPVVTPAFALTPARAHALADQARTAVSVTTSGVRIHGDGHEAMYPSPGVVPGVCIVQGRFSERGTRIDGRLIEAAEIAALLLNSPGLQSDQAILLADPDGGATTFAQSLAQFTGRVVIAADGPVETTSLGNLRVGNGYSSSGQFHIFLPGDTSAAVAELLETWLAPASVSRPDNPRTVLSTLRRRLLRHTPPPVAARPSRAPDESAAPVSAPPLSSRHRTLILEHRHEVVAGIWYRDENTLVMPTADPRLLRLTPGVIDVAIAGDDIGFLIGSERLSAADLATMLAHDPRVIGHPTARLRILGCETARNPALLQELADLTGRSVLAGNKLVYIGADRSPHTAAAQRYSPDGRPIFPRHDNGEWLEAHPAAPTTAPPRPAHVRPRETTHRRGLPPDLVEAAVAADPASWQRLGSGADGTVDLLVLADGAAIARKTTMRGRKAEILGSIVGQRLGANVPVVVAHPTDRSILMEYVAGRKVPRGTDANVRRGALLIELLDLLIINNDRHPGNLMLTDDGVAGFDHGRAFELDGGAAVPDPIHLLGNFVERAPGGRVTWVDNPLSPQDVEFLTEIVVSLRSDYQQYGFRAAYNVALDRLYHIGMHAKGEVSLIALPAPAPTRVQHHFGADGAT
ncbi:hypothetical protein [Nonomuraea sp. NPDC003754]